MSRVTVKFFFTSHHRLPGEIYQQFELYPEHTRQLIKLFCYPFRLYFIMFDEHLYVECQKFNAILYQ